MPHRTVVHLISNLDIGGAQEVVASLTPQLPAHGWQPLVVTLRDGPVRDRLEAAGVEVVTVTGRSRPFSSGPGALRDLARVRGAIGGLLAARDVDMVQTHLARSMDFVMLTLRRHRGRSPRGLAWTVHNARVELRADQVPDARFLELRRGLYRTAYWCGTRLGADVVAVSDEVARSVARAFRVPTGHLHTIANGVDMGRYEGTRDIGAIRAAAGLAPSDEVLIVVAKLYAQKGHRDLLEAVAELASERSRLRVLLLGEGPLRGLLEAEVRERDLDGVVRFMGVRHDVADLLAASDVFVLPSHWEGLPMALLEGMASGLPVVATSVSGTVQVVEDGVSGALVPPRDPHALAGAVKALLDDPERRASMGQAARLRVADRYSATAQARAHAELYDRILARHEGSRRERRAGRLAR